MFDFISHYAFVLVLGAIIAGFARHLRASPRIGAPGSDDPEAQDETAVPEK